jgi:hypothetical protein
MRCDNVFEILTSGPFPTGAAHDDAVEAHLLVCHECRNLAEALRPVRDHWEPMVPAYTGRLRASDSATPSQSLMDRVQSLVVREHASAMRSKNIARESSKRGFLRFAAMCASACVLGAAVTLSGAGLIREMAAREPEVEKISPVGLAVGERSIARCGPELLASIEGDGLAPVSYRKSVDACCLQCHGGNAGSLKSRHESVELVVMSCQKCHQSKSDLVRL